MSNMEKRPRRNERPTQLAARLGCGVSTIWSWAKNRDGFPQPIKLSERITVFDADAVDDFLHLQAVQKRVIRKGQASSSPKGA